MLTFSLLPKEKKFFVLFDQSAENAVKIAHQLKDLMSIWENVRERVGVITDLEHQGDAITHQIMAQLNRSFVTPFDREDIVQLAHSLDEVTDLIQAAADAMLLYQVERPTSRALEMADIVFQATAEVERAIAEIHGHIDREQLLKRSMEINRLENVSDGIYRAAIAELFADPTDMVTKIKWREIYKHMETAVDRCEDVADVLEGVALKYA